MNYYVLRAKIEDKQSVKELVRLFRCVHIQSHDGEV